jgi:hypothetical protein
MQSAFVECGADDRVRDEVVLLGNGVSEASVAAAWGTTEQDAMFQLSRCGERRYR